MEKKIAKALIAVGRLEGITTAHNQDEITFKAGYLDNYLLVGYLGQLLERGEIKLHIDPERLEFIQDLLESNDKCNHKTQEKLH